MSPPDRIDRKLRKLQDQMAKQAGINAITAAQTALIQIELISQRAAIELEAERSQALSFLFNQQTQRFTRYGFIHEAITMASNDYMGIMLSEGRKPLNIGLLVTFIAFAVLPEYGALSEACKILSDKWKPAISLAKSLGKTIDIGKYTSSSSGQDRRGAFGAINKVVEEVFDRILEDQADMGAVVQAFSDAILNGAPRPLQLVQDYWRRAKLQTLHAAKFVAAKEHYALLRNVILYDMLREYTRSYVVMSFDRAGPAGLAIIAGLAMQGRMLDSTRLKDVPNGIVNVKGLNDDQREMIYARFSNVPWKDPSRPPVNSWRDLVSAWGASVPGFDTERRVDARFIGKKGPF